MYKHQSKHYSQIKTINNSNSNNNYINIRSKINNKNSVYNRMTSRMCIVQLQMNKHAHMLTVCNKRNKVTTLTMTTKRRNITVKAVAAILERGSMRQH